MQPQKRQHQAVGGDLHGHTRPRVRKQPRHQIQRLLGALGEQDSVGIDCHTVRPQPAGERLAKRSEAGGSAVVQQSLCILREDVTDRAPQVVGRAEIRVGGEASEVDVTGGR